jgi:hypothetical protein
MRPSSSDMRLYRLAGRVAVVLVVVVVVERRTSKVVGSPLGKVTNRVWKRTSPGSHSHAIQMRASRSIELTATIDRHDNYVALEPQSAGTILPAYPQHIEKRKETKEDIKVDRTTWLVD